MPPPTISIAPHLQELASPQLLDAVTARFDLRAAEQPAFQITDDPAALLPDSCVLYVLTAAGQAAVADLPMAHLVFHEVDEALGWCLAHPEGKRYLHDATADGAELIRAGRLVAMPTETVYGLAADALNPAAVERIFRAKERPAHDPLIVHVSAPEQVGDLVTQLPDAAVTLMQAFWPGPLTLVLPKKPVVPDIVTSGHPTVAVRMSAHPVALELIDRAGTPVAAPSANLFGRTSPTTAQHVAEQLGDRCDLIIDAGACRVGVESTVLSLVGKEPLLLRHGGVSREAIEAIVGPIGERGKTPAEDHHSPGMLPSHYAPRTPLRLVDDLAPYANDPAVGIIVFHPTDTAFAGPVEQLSAKGNLDEAANRLYAAMRRLDDQDLRLIVAERVPAAGIGSAINDRLTRAACT